MHWTDRQLRTLLPTSTMLLVAMVTLGPRGADAGEDGDAADAAMDVCRVSRLQLRLTGAYRPAPAASSALSAPSTSVGRCWLSVWTDVLLAMVLLL